MDSRTQSIDLHLDDIYFLCDPRRFVRDHWCQMATWQMLEKPLSLAEFERSPLLPGFDLFGFTACKVEAIARGEERTSNSDIPCENIVCCSGAQCGFLFERNPEKWQQQSVVFFYNIVEASGQNIIAGHELLEYGVIQTFLF